MQLSLLWRSSIGRTFIAVVATFIIIVGLILFPLPIPFGAPLMAIGLILLISVSKPVAKALRRLRSRTPWLDNVIRKGEGLLPKGMRRILMPTDPLRRAMRRRSDPEPTVPTNGGH
ncbi:MAG: hypothetical protein AAGG72_00690 [Pseudomonadota bacterium]